MRFVGFCTAGLLAALMVAPAQADQLEVTWSEEVTECDRLAAHGLDPFHVGTPVSRASMDKPAAIAACKEAVAADPENPRLNYQLGRALGYSNRGEEAMPYRLKAVEKKYPQSLFVIGYLYFIGQTIDKDVCKTVGMWRDGAKYERLAAEVALPRHYMRGDFDGCGVSIPKAELMEYLEHASTQTSDFYTSMLIADLKTELDATDWSALSP